MSEKILIKDKAFLTVREVRLYTGIGEKRIRALVRQCKGTVDDFTVECGRKILIDKVRFVEIVRKCGSI